MVATQIRPLRRDVVAAFERSVTRLPEVLSVYTMAGSDDFLVHVTAPTSIPCTPSSSTSSPTGARSSASAPRSSAST
ncbi:Lrp/AsnC ligand binding domain-containing protein [Streptomyces sp. NPDC126514]|uniref:Lrp/AsnC ligand binding domain-containing protein n=1 Tax=Streptomyces sp. NPDC126514 TaxID=3155210 RepID=UPI003325A621